MRGIAFIVVGLLLFILGFILFVVHGVTNLGNYVLTPDAFYPWDTVFLVTGMALAIVGAIIEAVERKT
jgi:uncharacterized membrane protein